ncbi:MAG: EamA family transporter [Candidatus Aenigmarchaeota archaeon]|nr:EamA family transporter [Candidatus Aenigmarchaeota archaeon]
MGWELFALVAAFSIGIERLIHRHVMKKEGHIAYSWLSALLGGIFYLPLLAIVGFTIPASPYGWALAMFAGLIWAVRALIGFKSYRYTQVSLRDPVARTDVLFLLLFSSLILREPITAAKLLGVLVIFLGLTILTWHKGKIFGKFSHKGVRLTLLAAVLSGLVAVVDKAAVAYFLPALYGFLMFIIPAVYLTPLALRNKNEIKRLVSRKLFWAIIVSILAVGSYYLQLSAYLLTDVSKVFPVLQLSTLVTVIGGAVFHKEKDLGLRLIGAILMIVGSVTIIAS